MAGEEVKQFNVYLPVSIDQRHLLHPLREFEQHCNEHRPHRTLDQGARQRPAPGPITDSDGFQRLRVRRHDRLGGAIREDRHTA